MSEKKKYVLETIRRQAEDAVGGTDVEFEFKGQVYKFPNPVFWDDEMQSAFHAAKGNAASARVLLGDEQYEKFVKAGGDPLDVAFVVNRVQRDSQDALANDPGTPTPSSTS